MENRRWAVSFGIGQSHRIGNKTFGYTRYAVIEAPNYGLARVVCIELFGRKWCALYEKDAVEPFEGLEFVPIAKVVVEDGQ